MAQVDPMEGLSPISPPPGAHPVFFFTDRARKQMREKKDISRAVSPLPNIPPTPEQLDYEERLDHAVLRSTQLLQQAEELLEKLRYSSEEVTIMPSEKAEYQDGSNWTKAYEITKEMNNIWVDDEDDEDDDLDEVAALINLDESMTVSEETLQAIDYALLLPIRSKPQPPAQVSAWLAGSWNFREYRDADFEAEQQAMQSAYLGTPRSARASTLGAVSRQPSPGHFATNSMPDATALIPSIKRMYTSAQESLSRSSSPSRWQNLLKLDTKMKW